MESKKLTDKGKFDTSYKDAYVLPLFFRHTVITSIVANLSKGIFGICTNLIEH